MTAIWDIHGSVAQRLSQRWDPEVAALLKESLGVIYETVKDREEYKGFRCRYVLVVGDRPLLLDVLGDILAREWKQSDMDLVSLLTAGDLHDFDHALGTPSDPLYCRRHRRTHNLNCFGHHTEMLIARLPRARRDIVSRLMNARFSDG